MRRLNITNEQWKMIENPKTTSKYDLCFSMVKDHSPNVKQPLNRIENQCSCPA